MEELFLLLDQWGDKELGDYLLSLKGIKEVQINSDNYLKINIKYNNKEITPKIIFLEISLFLDVRKFPILLAFDKYYKQDLKEYQIIRDDICCEFCYKGAIGDLFAIDGISKVESNFLTEYYKKYDERDKTIINIKYDPNILTNKKMQEIEMDLNI